MSHSGIVDHPDLGPIPVDCDVLEVPASDLRLTACTVPDGEAADRPRLLDVLGVQTLT